jgi:hypothetical protein
MQCLSLIFMKFFYNNFYNKKRKPLRALLLQRDYISTIYGTCYHYSCYVTRWTIIRFNLALKLKSMTFL